MGGGTEKYFYQDPFDYYNVIVAPGIRGKLLRPTLGAVSYNQIPTQKDGSNHAVQYEFWTGDKLDGQDYIAAVILFFGANNLISYTIEEVAIINKVA